MVETPADTNGIGREAQRRTAAAVKIQKHYRGHRDRRALKGLRLTPTQRWDDALAEANYRLRARPVLRDQNGATSSTSSTDAQHVENRQSPSRKLWNKAVTFAKEAQHDDSDDVSSSSSGSRLSDNEARQRRREEKRARKAEKRKERIEYAKAMDLQYFLEMIDVKHRYGSNLRAYHQYWKQQDTHENFFHWLDYGAGLDVNLSSCSREQLDRERVRYLSREERQAYLVKVDVDGRLCWAKNGQRIDTTEKYKDSVQGIVPVDANSPEAVPRRRGRSNSSSSIISRSSNSSVYSSNSAESGLTDRYANQTIDGSGKVKKQYFQVSPSIILNRLLRKTTKRNVWIFVADTSFRLYVGIKQSGAFQHSSFLHGGRVTAAGLIKIKDGKLTKLSPLSGHYRPPANNFKRFLASLEESGVDMSSLTISKSYAVLVGLEAYTRMHRAKKKIKGQLKEKTMNAKDAITPGKQPGDSAKESDTKEKERILAGNTSSGRVHAQEQKQAMRKEDKQREQNTLVMRIMRRLRIRPREPRTAATVP